MKHNAQAFLAELHTAAAARRLHGDRSGQQQINQTIIALEAGEAIENDWTVTIAKRFLHDT
jgi:fructose-specific component phosphotransferase system IIB-like protein